MINIFSPEERRIQEIAIEAIRYADEKAVTLTDGLSKVASDYGLSNPEIENVCARMNHVKYDSLRIKDKLASFKKADFDDVVTPLSKVASQEQYATYFRKSLRSYLPGKDMEKVADEEIPADDFSRGDIAAIGEAANSNADSMITLNNERDKKLLQMRNTIVSLVQNGESLENVYEVLLKVWGNDNVQELNAYFGQLVNDLKAEGLIDSSHTFEIPDINDFPEREVDDNKLSKSASSIMEINGEIVRKEIVHDNLIHIMCKEGKFAEAKKIDEYVPNSFCLNEKIALTMTKGMTHGALLLGGAGVGLVSDIGDNLLLKLRGQKVKKELPVRFSELKEIPTQKYNDIYESVVGLNPTLLKAPLALSETIKKVYVHDTMDQGTINAMIRSGGRKPNVISQSLSQGIGAVLSSHLTDIRAGETQERKLEEGALQSQTRLAEIKAKSNANIAAIEAKHKGKTS